jgi:glutamate-1-semialdehyde 2,1-aminomutase
MRMISPDGPVYQAGTLAGNPLVTAAGLATLRRLRDDPGVYEAFDRAGETIALRLTTALREASIPGVVNHVGGMVGVFLGVDRARTWEDVARLDGDLFSRFFHAALRQGVLLPPSPYEAWFLMESHLDGELDRALDGLERAIAEVVA